MSAILTINQNSAAEVLPVISKTSTVDILGQTVLNAQPDEALRMLMTPDRKSAYFLNAHCANIMMADPKYRTIMQRADLVMPDGIGVEIAARMTGQKIVANLNGTDLVPLIARDAARRGLSFFLLGAKGDTAQRAAQALVDQNPTLRIAGTLNGYEDMADQNAVIHAINASGADIVVVGLGVPFQEKWIHRTLSRLNVRLAIGVGALLDFLAGNVVRAPKIVRKARMEWVWRLAMEPRRLAKRYIMGNPLFLAHATRAAAQQLVSHGGLKRVLDLTVSLGAIVALSPLLAMTMAAIKLDSKGPVFFKQTRVGLDGQTFGVYKFRSMHVDAEARRAALLATSDREGVCFKSRNDPRVTRVGRILRRFSIDELPQVFNILRGEMSVVGPRPALPEEVAAYPKRALGRLAVKPGLTGVWQVSGRADIGFDKMIDMDLSYARSRSVLLDIVLIAMTFKAVVSGRGAY